jgi:branched-chain amino acid transport system ATP-binding protein
MKNFEIPLLEVNNIDASYGNLEVLWDICLKVYEGSCVSLVGLNGAGKSTLLKAISGFVSLKRGTIMFNNKRIDKLDPWHISNLGITYVPEGRGIFTRLTVKENLLIGCYSKEKRRKAHELLKEVYRLFPVLEERNKQEAGTLSGGEQQMLALARGLMSEPKLLMLDEVTQGLAPKIREEIYKKIEEIKKMGITILMVDENVRKSFQISDYAYVLESGRITLSGYPSELIKNEYFIKAYFGV